MKKTRLFTFPALIAILAVCVLAGCGKKEDKITSVSLKDYDPNTPIEIALGDFDCNAYTLVVGYESGSSEEIALTEEMITETDIFKLYQIGDHEITINYGEQKYTFKVSIKRDTFGDLAFPENTVFTYDGKEHTVEVDGNIPANATVTYLGGNSFVNAGTYDVTAVVSCEGYITETLTTTVTIERAKYDMSGVKLEGKEVVYDGNSHSLEISGTLPEGVSLPMYTINDQATPNVTDVGEYKVKATFSNNDPNYEAIPEMEAMLKITPASYTVKDVDIVFKNEGGNIISDATKIYDGKSITFDLNDYSKLSKKLSVSFSVCDKDGNIISHSNKNTGIVDAGLYTVKVEFTMEDGKNYEPIEPLVRTFEVFKAEYPAIENVQFISSQITYDGKDHSIAIEGQLPDGVTVSYEYYLNDTLVVGDDGKPVQSVTDVGFYVVKAVFEHGDKNQGKIEDALATLNIQKMTVNTSTVGFFGERTIEYSGQPYEPTFTTWQASNGTDYDILQYDSVKYYVFDGDIGEYVEMGENELPTDVGLYIVAIDVSVSDEYSDIYTLDDNTISRQFEIVSAS